MANNNIKTIGKISLVDPNQFGNMGGKSNSFGDPNYNISVSLEDLCINVDLTTQTKGKSVLINDDVKNNTPTSISFIGHSDVGNKKVLTTKYTELTNDIGDTGTANSENLGITSINIEFTTSYAPIVTINFIDVRGSSLFQSGGNNPYAVFFKLPYPIFKLKIKGYYGKAVTYCLHLTKVNSLLNSETGNFEMTANFVGYTYALLSDLLLGYLKALPKMNSAKDLLHAKVGNKNLNYYLDEVKKLSKTIPKAGQQSTLVQQRNRVEEIREQLDIIERLIDSLYVDIINEDGFKNLKLVYPGKEINNQEKYIVFSKLNESYTEDRKIISEKFSKIKEEINKYNSLCGGYDTLKILENRSTESKFNDLLIYNIKSSDSVNETLVNEIKSNNISEDLAKKVTMEIINSSKINNNGNYVIVDLQTHKESVIVDKKKVIEEINIELESLIGDEIQTLITTESSITSTLHEIIDILAAHVDVFLKLIHNVAIDAENPTNTKRKDELKTLMGGNKLSKVKSDKIYPFPEYATKNNRKGVFIETYIGDSVLGVKNKNNVNELKFVDEFFDAMLAQAIDDYNNAILEERNLESFYPATILDTELSGKYAYASGEDLNSVITDTSSETETPPYERKNVLLPHNQMTNQKINTPNNLFIYLLERMIIFLGYTNPPIFIKHWNTHIKNLTQKEVETFAKIEAQEIYKSYKNNPEILNSLLGIITQDDFENYFKKIGEVFETVDLRNNLYSFVGDTNRGTTISHLSYHKLSGSNYGYINIWGKDSPKKIVSSFSEDKQTLLLILNENEYEAIKPLPTYNDLDDIKNETVVDLMVLKSGIKSEVDIKNSGLNAFNGVHGIQEIKDVKIGNNQLPLKYSFYRKDQEFGFFNDDIPYHEDFLLGDKKGYVRYVPTNTNTKEYNRNRNKLNPLVSWEIDKDSKVSTIGFSIPDPKNKRYVHHSLFGSMIYNAQFRSTEKEAKAFLFLNALPWYFEDNKNSVIMPALENLLKCRSAFINVPYLWPAFIGSLLWRKNIITEGIITDTALNLVDPIKYFFGEIDNNIEYDYFKGGKPGADELIFNPILLNKRNYSKKFRKIGGIFNDLPKQIEYEFIHEFKRFVRDEFDRVDNSFGKVDIGFISRYDFNPNNYKEEMTNRLTIDGIKRALNVRYENDEQYDKFIKNYKTFSIYGKTEKKQYTEEPKQYYANLYVEFNTQSDDYKYLMGLIHGSKWIGNVFPKIWVKEETEIEPDSGGRFALPMFKDDITTYLKTMKSEIEKFTTSNTSSDITKEIKEATFGTYDDNLIKFNMYRHFSSIYNKWISGVVQNDSVIYQCGKGSESLIDSFRFLDRSFNDIGKEVIINPFLVQEILKESSNQSIYGIISRILSENNFEFIALPNYIDYSNANSVAEIFKPIPCYEQEEITTGPTFICMYVGQLSTNLDIDGDNDGFDLVEGSEYLTNGDGDNQTKGAAFVVDYGVQNQNIFRNLKLDQAEFTETQESLEITEAIVNQQSSVQNRIGSQNLFNVYSTRSYRVESEMLGCPMIQPMMYFQLNNVPMFRGAYLIIRTKHFLKPNYMSTSFTGVRIKNIQTPIVDKLSSYSVVLSDYTSTITAELKSNINLKNILENNKGIDILRNIVGVYESRNSYYAYNRGESGKLGGIYDNRNLDLTKLTLREVRELQDFKPIDDVRRIFATGRYQVIPGTLVEAMSKLRLDGGLLYNKETQDKIFDEYLTKYGWVNIHNYVYGKNKGTQEDLENAIQKLGQQWAALPVINLGNGRIVGDVAIGGGANSYYGGVGVNRGVSKLSIRDMVLALIKTRVELNNGNKPQYVPDYVYNSDGTFNYG